MVAPDDVLMLLIAQFIGWSVCRQTVAEHHEAPATCSGEVPHRSPEHVLPPADEDLGEHPRLEVRLLVGEPLGSARVREIDDVQTSRTTPSLPGASVGPRAIIASEYASMKAQCASVVSWRTAMESGRSRL